MSMPRASAKENYLFPLVLVTCLFFLWGFAHGLMSLLNKQFQEALHITPQRATLLQLAYFGAYFVAALPAGRYIHRAGSKKGVLLGLGLSAAGAFLSYPSATCGQFEPFLLSLFILAAGLTCLETAATPYVAVLGNPETSTFRLNLSQSFSGLGALIAPLLGGALFFAGNEEHGARLDSVCLVYLAMGTVILLVALLFLRASLPEVELPREAAEGETSKSLFEHPHFVFGMVSQFCYVGGQMGIGALFIHYVTQYWAGTSSEHASYLLAMATAIFVAGRFVGTAATKVVPPPALLSAYAAVSVLLCACVMMGKGAISVYALIALFFFLSIMFPTIFALSLQGLGAHTKRAGSFIVMSIVGGGVIPYLMGAVAEAKSTATAYVVPLLCFIVVCGYGVFCAVKMRNQIIHAPAGTGASRRVFAGSCQ